MDGKIRSAIAAVINKPGSEIRKLLLEQGYELQSDLSAAAGLAKYVAYDREVGPYLKKEAPP